MKNKAAQSLLKRRNKIYGKEWLRANAKKAAKARWAKKRVDKPVSVSTV